MSLNMLIEGPAASTTPGADCRGWMAEAGFREATSSTCRHGFDGRRDQVRNPPPPPPQATLQYRNSTSMRGLQAPPVRLG